MLKQQFEQSESLNVAVKRLEDNLNERLLEYLGKKDYVVGERLDQILTVPLVANVRGDNGVSTRFKIGQDMAVRLNFLGSEQVFPYKTIKHEGKVREHIELGFKYDRLASQGRSLHKSDLISAFDSISAKLEETPDDLSRSGLRLSIERGAIPVEEPDLETNDI